jgi:hypothetical protein
MARSVVRTVVSGHRCRGRLHVAPRLVDAGPDRAWRPVAPGIAPLADGLRDGQARLVGSWPDTELEWTFALATRPGLRLRRRVPLYDELGRVSEPEHASIHLMEDLDTGGVPSAAEARDGDLDT